MTLPCTPNPAKARKAAAQRAAKEARLARAAMTRGDSSQELRVEDTDPGEHNQETSRKNTRAQTAKWYMGQYGDLDSKPLIQSFFLFFLKIED